MQSVASVVSSWTIPPDAFSVPHRSSGFEASNRVPIGTVACRAHRFAAKTRRSGTVLHHTCPSYGDRESELVSGMSSCFLVASLIWSPGLGQGRRLGKDALAAQPATAQGAINQGHCELGHSKQTDDTLSRYHGENMSGSSISSFGTGHESTSTTSVGRREAAQQLFDQYGILRPSGWLSEDVE